MEAAPNKRQQLTWVEATVVAVVNETSSARTLQLEMPGWISHLAGQHIDIRLTADDGYQANRSYSLSSGPSEPPQITVERFNDGEVSPYLVDIVEVGDTFEARGPIGGYFVWDPDNPQVKDRPLLLIGGGSGIAPLRAMWRAATGLTNTTILYSAQTRDRVIFSDELGADDNTTTTIHLTREAADGYVAGRIDRAALATATTATAATDQSESPAVFVCGPTAFVESVAQHLVDLDVDRTLIRTERFG